MLSNPGGESRERRRRSPDGERRRRRHSRSRSPKKPTLRRTAWDDPTGEMIFNSGSMLAPPVAAPNPSQASSSGQPGAAAFLTSAAKAALTRVYVGNVDFEVTEADLRGIFERCGPVRSVQLTKDHGNQHNHRGFCFVEFETMDSAETAIATMGGLQLAGRSLRVSRPHNPASSITPTIQASAPALQPILLHGQDEVAALHHLPQIRTCKMCTPGEPRTPAGYPLRGEPKIYVANVPASIPETALVSLFKPIGTIRSFKMEVYPDDKSKQFSVVEFEEEQAAAKAVSTFHGHKLEGLRLKVGRVLPLAAAQNTLIFQQVQQVAQIRRAGLPMPSNFGLSHMAMDGRPMTTPDSIRSEESMNISTGSARVALMQKLMRPGDAGLPVIPITPHGVSLPAPSDPRSLFGTVIQPTAPGEVDTPTRCVVLLNLVGSPKEVDDDLGVEVKEECAKFGHVEHLLIFDEPHPVTKQVEVKFFILYSNLAGAMKAVQRLNNRFFAKRRITCKYFHEALFRRLLAE